MKESLVQLHERNLLGAESIRNMQFFSYQSGKAKECGHAKRCIVSGCAKLAGNGEQRTNTGNAGKMIPLFISRFSNILPNLKSTTVQHFLYISSINLGFLIPAIGTKTAMQLKNN